MEDFKPQAVKGPSQTATEPTAPGSLIIEQELAPQGGWNRFKQFYSDNKWYFLSLLNEYCI